MRFDNRSPETSGPTPGRQRGEANDLVLRERKKTFTLPNSKPGAGETQCRGRLGSAYSPSLQSLPCC